MYDEFADFKAIAVLGITGGGKSTFIRYATGGSDEIMIGGRLESCTADVTPYVIPSRKVILIDTPGFDDTHRSDTDILSKIATCLMNIFHAEMKLTGIIYIHPIDEVRMKGSAVKNLIMFRKMIGESNMNRCCMVTTKWSREVYEIAVEREKGLRDGFWKPIRDRGARVVRFEDSEKSALDIINPLLTHESFTSKLTTEMVEQHKSLGQTEAGQEVCDQLEETKKSHEEQIQQLKKEHSVALKDQDYEYARLIETEKSKLEREIDQMKSDRRRLDEKHEEDNRAWEQKLSQQSDYHREEFKIGELRRRARSGRWRARYIGAALATAYIASGGGVILPLVSILGLELGNQIVKDSEDERYNTRGIQHYG